MRKIINISTTSNGCVIAICNDGTCWFLALAMQEKGWKQLPDIPQDGFQMLFEDFNNSQQNVQ